MHMTADGMVLRTCRCTDVTVAMGDRVKLWNGWTGYAHNWTEGGIMLRLDHACRPFVGRLLVLAIEVGDGDIESVHRKEIWERISGQTRAERELAKLTTKLIQAMTDQDLRQRRQSE